MNKRTTADFATISVNNVITQVGKSQITSPGLNFKGGSIKWFDDSKLLRKKDN